MSDPAATARAVNGNALLSLPSPLLQVGLLIPWDRRRALPHRGRLARLSFPPSEARGVPSALPFFWVSMPSQQHLVLSAHSTLLGACFRLQP